MSLAASVTNIITLNLLTLFFNRWLLCIPVSSYCHVIVSPADSSCCLIQLCSKQTYAYRSTYQRVLMSTPDQFVDSMLYQLRHPSSLPLREKRHQWFISFLSSPFLFVIYILNGHATARALRCRRMTSYHLVIQQLISIIYLFHILSIALRWEEYIGLLCGHYVTNKLVPEKIFHFNHPLSLFPYPALHVHKIAFLNCAPVTSLLQLRICTDTMNWGCFSKLYRRTLAFSTALSWRDKTSAVESRTGTAYCSVDKNNETTCSLPILETTWLL